MARGRDTSGIVATYTRRQRRKRPTRPEPPRPPLMQPQNKARGRRVVMPWNFPNGLQCVVHDDSNTWFDFGCNSNNQLLAVRYNKKHRTPGHADYVLQTANGHWTLPGFIAQTLFIPGIMQVRMTLWSELIDKIQALENYQIVFRELLPDGTSCSFTIQCSYSKAKVATPCIKHTGSSTAVNLSLWVENMVLVPQGDFPLENIRYYLVSTALDAVQKKGRSQDVDLDAVMYYCVNCYNTFSQGCSLCR